MKQSFLVLIGLLSLPLFSSFAQAGSQECEWALERCRNRCSDTYSDPAKAQACAETHCTAAQHPGACGGSPSSALGEVSGYVPRHLVHSNGKAYTECQSADEQQQSFRGRQICVNADGDYYFLAD